MAFPVREATSTWKNVTSETTSHTITLPAGIVVGELLLCMVALDAETNEASVDTFTGWTSIGLTIGVDTTRLRVFRRVADGADPTAFTTDLACFTSGFTHRISGAEDPATQGPEASAGAIDLSANPNPDQLTPTGGAKDYLWFALCTLKNSVEVAAAPTNYTGLTALSGDGSNRPGTAFAERSLNASSEDPGSFDTNQFADQWAAATIAIHPSGAGAVDNARWADMAFAWGLPWEGP